MRRSIVVGLVSLGIIGGVLAITKPWIDPSAVPVYAVPSPMATWPLPGAKTSVLRPGVTHTFARGSDGTDVDFLDFDFSANPKLRFEIFDQDEDDDKPLDNHVMYWDRNVARATKELNAKGRGPVVAAWNGAFFGYDNSSSKEDAFHVSPVVLRGKVHFNTANHRWAWGVKQTAQGPVWKTFFKPSRQTLEKEFDYAAGSVQCLIKDGKPLKTEPFPPIGGAFREQPVPSTAEEAGHIPKFDHMRTCRASVGWSRDNKHLYLLTVKEPDDEGSSSVALSWSVRGGPIPGGTLLTGGWTVPDVQQFWISKGVWGAINSDAGGVLQLVFKKPNGNYTFIPPRQETGIKRIECGPNWQGAIEGGGGIMYFLVREK
ncbi:hypothetical protein EON80_07090 [bacterium]|nr:MAG: hypothetical protein EON80_07090 [bacterium]